MEIQPAGGVIPLLKTDVVPVQPLTAGLPGFNHIKVIQFCHAPARRREKTRSIALYPVDLRTIQDIPEDDPPIGKSSAKQHAPQFRQTGGIIDLISVHPKDPCHLPHERNEEGLGFDGIIDPMNFKPVRILLLQPAEDARGAVLGLVIRNNEAVTEGNGVSERPFHVDILVADQTDTDNLHGWDRQILKPDIFLRSHRNQHRQPSDPTQVDLAKPFLLYEVAYLIGFFLQRGNSIVVGFNEGVID